MDNNNLYVLFIYDISKPKLPIIRIKYQLSLPEKRIGPFLDIRQEKNKKYILNKEDSELIDNLVKLNYYDYDRLFPQILLDRNTCLNIYNSNKCFILKKKNGSIRKIDKHKIVEHNEISNISSKTIKLLHGHIIYKDNIKKIYWEYENSAELVRDLPNDGYFLYLRDNNGIWHTRDITLESNLKTELYAKSSNELIIKNQNTSPWKFIFQEQRDSFSYSYGKIDWFDASNIEYLTHDLGVDIDEIIASYLNNRNFLHGKEKVFFFEKPISEILDEDTFSELVCNKIKIPNQKISTLQKKIPNTVTINNIEQELSASNFRGNLKKYQLDALFWLLQLRRSHIGGILADEMGLGKTVEIISYIMVSIRNGNGPFLIICPKTLIENWKSEFVKFTEKQSVTINFDYKKISSNIDQITILTYKIASMHSNEIANYKFDTIILDEAQFIKNSSTKTYRDILSLSSFCNVALTGTPIENYLTDLWSLLTFTNHFLVHPYLKLKKIFTDFKRNKIAASFSYKVMGNIILHRTKEDVMLNIPPMNSEIIFCEMGYNQHVVYISILEIFRKMLSDGIGGRIESIALEAISRLRQVCSDPSMLPPFLNKQNCIDSIKIETCINIVNKCITNGEKIIIFTQFHHVTDRLAFEFKSRNIIYYILDGRSKDRSNIINNFEKTERGVFIIGLKSGGFGMNLTSASNVLLFDPWWNPAIEEQAYARTHRIGQQKIVTTKKLICSNTIEEKMLKLIENKRQLSNSIFDLAYTPNIDDLVKIIQQT